jgi:hypothetical protein
METERELADQLYRERVERARRMTPEEKLQAGPRLFEQACQVMQDGIRHQFPDADANRVEEILRERLDIIRRLEGRP